MGRVANEETLEIRSGSPDGWIGTDRIHHASG